MSMHPVERRHWTGMSAPQWSVDRRRRSERADAAPGTGCVVVLGPQPPHVRRIRRETLIANRVKTRTRHYTARWSGQTPLWKEPLRNPAPDAQMTRGCGIAVLKRAWRGSGGDTRAARSSRLRDCSSKHCSDGDRWALGWDLMGPQCPSEQSFDGIAIGFPVGVYSPWRRPFFRP